MMSRTLWAIPVCFACLIGLVATFLLLQAAALAWTSDQKVIELLRQNIRKGTLTTEDFPISPYGHTWMNYAMFDDCQAISMNLGNEGTPLLERIAAMPVLIPIRNGILSECKWLTEDVRAGTIKPTQPYFRYWHGYQIYFRPLLGTATLATIRKLNAMLLIGALTFFLVQMSQRFGFWTAPAVLIPLLLGTNILTSPAMTVDALIWIWAFFSIGIFAYWHKRHARRDLRTVALVFSLGCIANFFDLLFSPPFAPTFVAFLVVADGLRRGDKMSHLLCGAAELSLYWFLGYSLAWVSKWVFAVAVMGWNVVVPNIVGQIYIRTYGTPGLSSTFFAATKIAFQDANAPMIYISWIITLAVLARILFVRKGGPIVLRDFAVLITPLVMPVLWVEVLRDHTIVHPLLESRSFVFFAIMPLLASLIVWSRSSSARKAPLTRHTGKSVSGP